MHLKANLIDHCEPRQSPVAILGVRFDKVTIAGAIAEIEKMIASRQPHFLVTANVDFVVQARHDDELRRILANADLSLCDGTPLIWASRLLGCPLPERVAGSDLTPLLLRMAADKGWRVYFLGATPDSCAEAVSRLNQDLPALNIVGHYSPPFRALTAAEDAEMTQRIRAARPDFVFVAFGCPKAEKWIARHYKEVGAPAMIGVGATIDFLAGRVKRAPEWMRRSGLEWLFRLIQEPRRLWRRYTRDIRVFILGVLAQWMAVSRNMNGELPHAIQRMGDDDVLDLSNIRFISSEGIGLLLQLRKKLRSQGRRLILASPSARTRRALRVMRLENDFVIASNVAASHPRAVPLSTQIAKQAV